MTDTAVVLAAGRGTRMGHLTDTCPKPMLLLGGRPILEHILFALPDSITNVVIVIDYRGDQIREYFGFEWREKRIQYVKQEQKGTFGALASAEYLLPERFLVLNGDDLIGRKDLSYLLEQYCGVLAFEHPEPQNFGVIQTQSEGRLLKIVEQPKDPVGKLVNTGAYLLPKKIFDMHPPRRGDELLLAPTLTELATHVNIWVEVAEFWFPIGTPEALTEAERLNLHHRIM